MKDAVLFGSHLLHCSTHPYTKKLQRECRLLNWRPKWLENPNIIAGLSLTVKKKNCVFALLGLGLEDVQVSTRGRGTDREIAKEMLGAASRSDAM